MLVVTGATGQLGQFVVRQLVKRVPASSVVAIARDPKKASALGALGVTVRPADYSKPESLLPAFQGAKKLLLISSNEIGKRTEQHGATITAAKSAGVQLLVYTSLLRADSSRLALADEHKQTERLIQESGIPYVVLRIGWYTENFTAQIEAILQHDAMLGAAGEGKFSTATRADYAEAAVNVLVGEGHTGKIYELAGDVPYTHAEFVAEVSKQSGKSVVYKDMSEAEYEKALIHVGVPAPFAHILADSDAWGAKGELQSGSSDLSNLLGRATTSLADAVSAALRKK